MTVRQVHDELSKELSRGMRTIRRTLDQLCSIGILRSEDDHTGDSPTTRYIAAEESVTLRNLKLTLEELFALYIAKKSMSPLTDSPFQIHIDRTFQKIEELLPSRKDLDDFQNNVHFSLGTRWAVGIDQDILTTIESACHEGQTLSVRYASVNSETNRIRKLGPHFMYFAKEIVMPPSR